MAALVGAAALCGALALALAGCAGGSAGGATGAGGLGGTDAGDSGASASGPISVYSREDGSGTRGAFVELLGIEQADANGDKVDMTTSTAAITNSTAVMMTSVAGDPNAIGYISLGSLDDTVKALNLEGAEPTEENIKAGSYFLSRPFVMATKGDLSQQSELVQALFAYLQSDEGAELVKSVGLITVE